MWSVIKFLFCLVCQGGWLPATLTVFAFWFQIGTAHGDNTFTVVNTADSGQGSLRWAITNANAYPGTTNRISFNISGTAPFTINLLSALPAVANPWTVVDAATQPGWANSGTPVVELNGTSAGSGVGLQLNSAFNTVVGLAINRFPSYGIALSGVSNVIQDNFIGTDTTGAVARGNGGFGIYVASAGNRIGGSKAGNGNVISGNNDNGIYINTTNNVVQGNYIGINATGANALGNKTNGVVIYGGSGNLIGGPGGARNYISGNGTSGVYLYGSSAGQNVISNNFIGTDQSGELVISNLNDGITISGAPSNAILGNVISSNGTNGVFLSGAGATGNIVAGNLIGTDAAGKLALGNDNAGVTVTANGNLIGPSNVISGNLTHGIFLTGGASGNFVQGNIIGLSAAGTNGLPNRGHGINISGASSNTIGGTLSAARNVISGNALNGIAIFMITDTLNTICGNYIGTDVSGKKSLANTLVGVLVQGCSNTVGGVTAGSGNVISGNGLQGIYLQGTNGSVFGNIVQGNLIGLDATGMISLGNGDAGIGVSSAARNQIGGTTIGTRNVISANADEGLFIDGTGATNNIIQGNYIGTDITGMTGHGNGYEGITLQNAIATQVGGTVSGAGNLISANNNRGIYMASASWNVVLGNFIGTKADGTNALGNLYHNIDIDAGSISNTIGGAAAGAGNHIEFAQTPLYSGVRVRTGAMANLISGNCIFSNAELGIDLSPPDGSSGYGTNSIVHLETNVAVNAANAGQNYPVLTNVYCGTATQIRGTFDSGTNKTYVLQFFSSPVGNKLGCGEGQVFLGQTNLALGAICPSNFTVLLPGSVPQGWVITATATDPANNTSEFSAWIPVLAVPRVLPGAINPANRQFSLSWTNNGGSYVLQQTFSLNPPQQWTIVTNAPHIANGFSLLTLPATNAVAFYRLLAQ
jgi:titin